MEIRIIKNKNVNNSYTCIDFQLVRKEQITDSEVLEYQEVFGKIVASDIKQYLLSDLLNREDGSTHFLNKILKLLACINLIQVSENNLLFFNTDRAVLISLRNYCKENNIEVRPLIAGDMSKKPMWVKNYGEVILPNCQLINEYGFYIPNHQDLTSQEINIICNIINNVQIV